MIEEECKKNQIRKPICGETFSQQKYVELQNSGSEGRAAIKAGSLFNVNPMYVKDAKRLSGLIICLGRKQTQTQTPLWRGKKKVKIMCQAIRQDLPQTPIFLFYPPYYIPLF